MKKHIVCIGDSNTHGYCADPADCAEGGIRFNEDERWTCLLQKALGEDYLVTEEGLSGRTTVFPDPLHESMDALGVIYALLKSHEAVDLLVIMLGTNDVKERLGANAACIAIGMCARPRAWTAGGITPPTSSSSAPPPSCPRWRAANAASPWVRAAWKSPGSCPSTWKKPPGWWGPIIWTRRSASSTGWTGCT